MEVIHSIRRNLCAAVAAMFQEHKCVPAMVLITSSTSAVIAVQWLSFSASEQLIFAMPVTRIFAMSRKCQNMLCLNVLPVCIINSLSVFSISFNYETIFTGPRGRQLDGDECPLHLVHPPTGEEFALGCGMCRNAHTF